jgi:putative long chain acyl-CoA synthase
MRGVFEPGDSWIPTENLFRRDSDGDYWLVDRKDTVVKTARGPVFTQPIIDAFGEVPEVVSVVVYGVVAGQVRTVNGVDYRDEVAVCGISLREDKSLPARTVTDAMAVLLPVQRPDIVHVVDHIPLGRAYRPGACDLQKEGVPAPSTRTWFFDNESGDYRRLTKAIAAERFGSADESGRR